MDKMRTEYGPFRRPELSVLAAESVLLGAVMMAAVIITGPKLAALASGVWFGIGVAVLMVISAPVHVMFARLSGNGRVSAMRSVAAAVAGGIVAALVYQLVT